MDVALSKRFSLTWRLSRVLKIWLETRVNRSPYGMPGTGDHPFVPRTTLQLSSRQDVNVEGHAVFLIRWWILFVLELCRPEMISLKLSLVWSYTKGFLNTRIGSSTAMPVTISGAVSPCTIFRQPGTVMNIQLLKRHPKKSAVFTRFYQRYCLRWY